MASRRLASKDNKRFAPYTAMSVVDYSKVPESVWVELCVLAIKGTAQAMKTQEGRAAIEKHRQEYIAHLEEKRAVENGA